MTLGYCQWRWLSVERERERERERETETETETETDRQTERDLLTERKPDYVHKVPGADYSGDQTIQVLPN